jgi:uncharacterized membrane protein YdjX (TVP38/TMEM64 family)
MSGIPSDLRRVRPLWHVLAVILLAGVGVAIWRSGVVAELNWGSLARHQAELLALAAAHPLIAGTAYVGLYTAIVFFALPEAAIVTICGGLVFGTLIGGALAVLGATLGAVALFVVARTAFAEVAARRARRLVESIRPRLQRDGFSYILALRLVPAVPFWLINIAAPLCGMRLFPFAAATLIGIVPATFVFAWVGSGVGTVLAAGGKPDLAVIFSPHILGPLLALALLALSPVMLRRLRNNRG